jgi:hypothetical protein
MRKAVQLSFLLGLSLMACVTKVSSDDGGTANGSQGDAQAGDAGCLCDPATEYTVESPTAPPACFPLPVCDGGPSCDCVTAKGVVTGDPGCEQSACGIFVIVG